MTKLPAWRWVMALGLLFGLPLLFLFVDTSPEALQRPCQSATCKVVSTLILGVLVFGAGQVLRSIAKPITWGRRLDGTNVEFPALLRADPPSPAASMFQERLRGALHPEFYQRVVHDGADGLMLQDLKGPGAGGRHLFFLCHFRLQHDSPLFIGCLRAYLGQVAPNKLVHLVVCGSMEEMEQSTSQWKANRFMNSVVPIVVVQRVDPVSGETRLDGLRTAATAQVTAAVAEVAQKQPPTD